MKLVSSKFTAITILVLTCAPAFSTWAQEDSSGISVAAEPQPAPYYADSIKPLIFVEIELTNEGVVAYDSAGDRWTYDFETLRFVTDDAPTREGGGRESHERTERVEPVEIRCTEEKVVDYPSLAAVYIGSDEYVNGDIKSYSRVTIKGWVKGNVQSFNKTVLITSTGQVDGDVKAPEVVVKDGGLVKGEIVETPQYEIPVEVITTGLSSAGIWVVFGFTLGLSLTVFLVSALAPSRVANVTACVVSYPLRASLTGLLFVFLIPVIIVLVVLTVIGLLVVWLVPIAYFVAFALGVCATSAQVLTVVVRRLGKSNPGMPTASIIGIAFYMGLWALVALIFDSATADAPGILLLLLAIFATCYPVFAGTGAVVMTRFGSRSYLTRRKFAHPSGDPAPAPAPPPIPQAPPGVERSAPGSSPGPISSDPGRDGV
jgi:hypothetical protein